jgi:hypothetical protein
LINSDFNHQNGTHRQLFQIVDNRVTEFDQNGNWYRVKQESTRVNNSLGELLTNPVLLTIPKILKSTVEYFFPSVLVLYAESGVGPFAQVVVQYPQQDLRVDFRQVQTNLGETTAAPINVESH